MSLFRLPYIKLQAGRRITDRITELTSHQQRGRSLDRIFRRIASVMLMLVIMPVLSACGTNGFRPLHGPTASGGNLGALLAQVKISSIPGRVGQQLRNELIFQTRAGGEAADPAYILSIVIRESVSSTLVQRSGESYGQVYNLDVSFELTNIKTKRSALRGRSYGRAGFERFVSAYANVRARIDAENRAAKTVAREIKNRLAAYLAGNA